MNEINKAYLNDVKNRFLPLPRSAAEGLEHEPVKEDFDFIKELGIGSFGKVHLVSHKKTKAQYAIKYIDKTDPQNIEEKANFNREVEIMYKLNHPNIVKLYGHFEDAQYCYFIMQYIPKRSVFDIITKPRQAPNLKLIASVMKDLLSAVYYLHNMKPTIIHRDIKPENILLDENTKAYLTDFGWSNYKLGDRRRNTVCGTPLYLPPEMIGEIGHDETADIWCIGVLLFELITGRTPFAGNDFETVRYNISRLNISWPPTMDPDAKDLTSKILKLNGKERLPIEQILSHKFFAKFFPNAVNELIKPENQKNKIFVISTDDPKTFGIPNKQTSTNSNANKTNPTPYTNISSTIRSKNTTTTPRNVITNNNYDKYKKTNNTNSNKNGRLKENPNIKNRTLLVPRANIDLSDSKHNEKSNGFIRTTKTINTSIRSYNTKNPNYIRSSSNSNNSFTNVNYRNSYKHPSIKSISSTNTNSSYSNDKFRNSYKNSYNSSNTNSNRHSGNNLNNNYNSNTAYSNHNNYQSYNTYSNYNNNNYNYSNNNRRSYRPNNFAYNNY